MATAKVTTMRLGPEDLAIIEQVQQRMGLFSASETVRFVLRQYALANGIELQPKPKPAKKRKP
ncbi:MAG: hypothetical protein R3B07_32150 [Polyangiaceae bacterium]